MLSTKAPRKGQRMRSSCKGAQSQSVVDDEEPQLTFQISIGISFVRDVFNVSGKFPAAGTTYTGFVGQAVQVLSAQQIIQLR